MTFLQKDSKDSNNPYFKLYIIRSRPHKPFINQEKVLTHWMTLCHLHIKEGHSRDYTQNTRLPPHINLKKALYQPHQNEFNIKYQCLGHLENPIICPTTLKRMYFYKSGYMQFYLILWTKNIERSKISIKLS